MNLQLIVINCITSCNAIKIPSEYTNKIVATGNMRRNIIAIVLLCRNIQATFFSVHANFLCMD